MLNGVTNFLFDAKVHDTVLITMIITSCLSALPVPPAHPVTWYGILYKFGYDWVVGFWSMKTGQKNLPPPPSEPLLLAASTSTVSRTVSSSETVGPILPESTPAPTK